jgi:hypothetical protein
MLIVAYGQVQERRPRKGIKLAGLLADVKQNPMRDVAPLSNNVEGEGRPISAHPPASQNVPDEMSKQKRQQKTSDATNPEEKMLGQFWGIDLFLVHD